MVLEAIRYERGKLELLDQLALPGHTEWLSVGGTAEAWDAIKRMNVRGAPAIAVAAALSLAVELHGMGAGAFAGAAAVAAHATARLDYLVTSRPTAVNLAEAAGRLRAVAAAAAEPAAECDAAAALERIIAAAEALLPEDVATNRAIGANGAAALAAAAGGRAKLRVLTHCNTGSLATAGFGTALGVIRALAEQGRLEHVYCCETRPYNQGARLTAYELVHDGLPATLVCDSAAAALMAQGGVDAVVVGADRVAANGDTANKIGTYCHAVAAKHHGVPFFVAAPRTTLDPATPAGSAIVIEQRPAEEVTHHAGQRVAAPGIGVWNPSFDVTPADLIEGIITEAGVLVKPEGAAAFPVPQHVGVAPPPGTHPDAPAGFYALDETKVLDYVAGRPELAEQMGGAGSRANWRAREVGDGNINFVYIVEGGEGGKSLVVKQGLPYVRVVGEGMPLTQERARYEVVALREAHRLCPAHAPAVYLHDETMCTIGMRYLEPPHEILRGAMIRGDTFPLLASHMGEFLAQTLFNTSAYALGGAEFRTRAVKFGANDAMCGLTEAVIFTQPYYTAELNHHTSPQLDADAEALKGDAELKAAVASLKRKFMECRQALIHGDLHTGSVMTTQSTSYVIDPEFAFYGPMGFDVGAFLGNLLMSYLSLDGHATAEKPRKAQRAWVAECFAQTWDTFERRFRELWSAAVADGRGDASPAENFGADAQAGAKALADLQAKFLREVWADSLGFAGCKMTRRVVGVAHVADLDSIEPADARAACQRRVLRLARRLVVEPLAFGGPADVLAAAEAQRNDGAQPLEA